MYSEPRAAFLIISGFSGDSQQPLEARSERINPNGLVLFGKRLDGQSRDALPKSPSGEAAGHVIDNRPALNRQPVHSARASGHPLGEREGLVRKTSGYILP